MEYLYIDDANGEKIPFSKVIFGGSGVNFLREQLPSDFLSVCFAKGMNTFDLARVYGKGKSEQLLGKWMKENHIPRDKVTIITKCCHPSFAILPRVNYKCALNDVEASLKDLGVNYVDCLFLHRDNPLKRPEEIITFMNELIKKGYTRSIGVSNWNHNRIEQANRYAKEHHLVPFLISECQYSLGVRVRDPWHNGTLSLTGDQNQIEREYYRKNNLPNLCYSSLGDGFFSGKFKANDPELKKKLTSASRSAYYSQHNLKVLERAEQLAREKNCSVATIALSYCLSQEIESACITTVSSLSRLDENLNAVVLKLTKEEIAYLQLKGEE